MPRTTSELAFPFPSFHTTPAAERLCDLACTMPLCTADLQWNRVSNLQPSGSEAETLPVGHRGIFGIKSFCLCAILFANTRLMKTAVKETGEIRCVFLISKL
ncbi:hypothetical protein AVEN_259673-1 [Araneus ventricosus]|uniref:Uncharacterized protein n=1 Tax=Araneus ventricosus TaxID=182803 RepID=A0A4Y2Q7M2_ARAVE|nr:hypothetical protein AVEN_259673-1 [Araneus ventricosus]